MARSAVFFSIWMLCICSATGTKTPLYVGALFETSQYWYAPYSLAFKELIEVAFEEIGNRSDILQDYELKLIVKDTQGLPGLAAKRLYEMIHEPPTKIAILGPNLSGELVLVGEITPFYNLLQLNFIAGTSTIKNRDVYSSLYSVAFIQDDLNPLRIAMMRYFGWTRVATIVFDQDYFGSQIDEFHSLLQAENWTLVTSSVVVDIDRTHEHIQRLKQYDARIIFGAFRSTQAPAIFCEAYRQGMYGHKYVWILPGAAMYTSWTGSGLDDSELPCTKEQILEAARGYITLDHALIGETDHQTISGRTPTEYITYMTNYLSQFPYKISRKHAFAYDSAWSLALCLNASLGSLDGSELSDYDHNNTAMYQTLKTHMEQVNFYGASGPVSFENGRRIGLCYIHSNADFVRRVVAKFDPSSKTINWTEDAHLLFEGGKIPKDVFTYMTKQFNVPLSVLIPVIVCDIIGVLLAVGFLIFNMVFRENKNIKLSSPRVNNVIILGAIIMYLTVFVSTYMSYSATNDNHALCMINTWVYSIGFTTAFGALFSKTWRVHVLFQQRTLRKKVIKDMQLFGQVVILLLIDIILLTAWTVTHPLQMEEYRVNEDVSDDDVVLSEIFLRCNHTYFIYWAAAEYVYKGLLLIFGTFLAWETRNISVPILNDSRLIGFCLYNIVVACAIGVPTTYLLTVEQALLKYILVNILTIFCTTVVLCILFIPKISLRNQTESLKFVPTLRKTTNKSTGVTGVMLTTTTPLPGGPVHGESKQKTDDEMSPMNTSYSKTKGLLKLSIGDLPSRTDAGHGNKHELSVCSNAETTLSRIELSSEKPTPPSQHTGTLTNVFIKKDTDSSRCP